MIGLFLGTKEQKAKEVKEKRKKVGGGGKKGGREGEKEEKRGKGKKKSLPMWSLSFPRCWD